MGVGKLLELAVKRSAGGAAREVQERISAAASGRGTRVNWWVYRVPGEPVCGVDFDGATSFDTRSQLGV